MHKKASEPHQVQVRPVPGSVPGSSSAMTGDLASLLDDEITAVPRPQKKRHNRTSDTPTSSSVSTDTPEKIIKKSVSDAKKTDSSLDKIRNYKAYSKKFDKLVENLTLDRGETRKIEKSTFFEIKDSKNLLRIYYRKISNDSIELIGASLKDDQSRVVNRLKANML